MSEDQRADTLLEDCSSGSLLDSYWEPAENTGKRDEMVLNARVCSPIELFSFKSARKGSIFDG